MGQFDNRLNLHLFNSNWEDTKQGNVCQGLGCYGFVVPNVYSHDMKVHSHKSLVPK